MTSGRILITAVQVIWTAVKKGLNPVAKSVSSASGAHDVNSSWERLLNLFCMKCKLHFKKNTVKSIIELSESSGVIQNECQVRNKEINGLVM